jgi:hypothetical protein
MKKPMISLCTVPSTWTCVEGTNCCNPHGFLTSAVAGTHILPHLGSPLLNVLCGSVGPMCNV